MAIAFGSASALVSGTTSVAVGYPSGTAVGDLLLLCATCKYSAFTSAPPTGFLLVHERVAGSGGTGIDAGNTRTAVWARRATGSEVGGSVTVSKATETGTAIQAMMLRYSGAATWNVLGESGQSSTGTTLWTAVTPNNLVVRSGDVVVVASGVNTDGSTFSSHGVAASGATFSAAVEHNDTGTNNGHDIKLLITEHTATAGPSTTFATFTTTANTGTPDGGSVIVRISDGYPFAADQGSYTLTPQTALFRRSMVASYFGPGGSPTYVLSGQPVTWQLGEVTGADGAWGSGAWANDAWTGTAWAEGLTATNDFPMPAEQGSYTLTGPDAAVLLNPKLLAGQGSYTLSGQNIGFSPGPTLEPETGIYTLTGQSAGSKRTYRFDLNAAIVYATTSIDVLMYPGALTGMAWLPDSWYSGAWYGTVWADNASAPGAPSIKADTGYYGATQAATTSTPWYAEAWFGDAWAAGAWGINIGSTNLVVGRKLTAEYDFYVCGTCEVLRDILLQTVPTYPSNVYTLSGQAATLSTGVTMTADTGSYTLTGQSAGLLRGKVMDAGFGAYATEGFDVEFVIGQGETADPGYYTLTGFDVTFSTPSRTLTAETGYYALTGYDTSLQPGNYLAADWGSYQASLQEALSLRGYTLTAETGYYTLGGQLISVPVEPPSRAKNFIDGGVAGKPIRKRSKKKLEVEIDGEVFPVESMAEAEELLKAAKGTYEEQIQDITSRLIQKASDPLLNVETVRMPRIRAIGPSGPELDALIKEVAAMRAEIKVLYEQTAAMQKKIINDDEEALALLL